PPGEAWSQTSVAEANAIVREHVAGWREMRRPVPQPEAVAGDPAGTAGADAAPARSGGASPAAPGAADARLEIVPAMADGASGTGTQTGTAAGGEGDMLQQQELVQTRETLAAREAELEELKSRLAAGGGGAGAAWGGAPRPWGRRGWRRGVRPGPAAAGRCRAAPRRPGEAGRGRRPHSARLPRCRCASPGPSRRSPCRRSPGRR